MQVHMYRRKGESPYWHAQAYVGGRRYRFSCETDDKTTAREFARQRVEELKARHNRGLIGLPEPIRVSAVFDRYEREALPRLRPSSAERAKWIVREARQWFVAGPLRDPSIGSVTPADIAAYLDRKGQTGVTARTVNLHRAILHRVFRLCVRPWLLIPSNPVSAVEKRREDHREPVLLTPEQYQKLLTATISTPMLRLFVLLGYETGARRGELLQLEWSDVDFEHRLVTFANDPARGKLTKGHRSRTVPLSDTAVEALRAHATRFRFSDPPSPYVFQHTDTRHDTPSARTKSFHHAFKRAARRASVGTVRFHDLRHLFCTRKLAAGVPAQLVMRYVGHADLATTLRYTHLVPEHLRAVVESAPRANQSDDGWRQRR